MLIGLDLLALPMYSSVAEKALPEGWALGAFHNVTGWGPALPHIRKILKKRTDIPQVRIHLNWADDHVFRSYHLSFIEDMAKKYERLAQDTGKTIVLSPYCEHRLPPNSNLVIKAKEIITSVAPNCIFINNPEKPSGINKSMLTETHDFEAFIKNKNFYNIFSFDGKTPDKNRALLLLNKPTTVNFIWNSSFNGKNFDEEKIAREKRTAYPTVKSITNFLKNIGL